MGVDSCACSTHRLSRPEDEETQKWHRDVVELVHEQTGATYFGDTSTDYNKLSHIKGDMSMQKFHAVCCAHTGPVPAVKIMQTGKITAILLQPDDKGKLSIVKHLHEPYPKTEYLRWPASSATTSLTSASATAAAF